MATWLHVDTVAVPVQQRLHGKPVAEIVNARAGRRGSRLDSGVGPELAEGRVHVAVDQPASGEIEQRVAHRGALVSGADPQVLAQRSDSGRVQRQLA